MSDDPIRVLVATFGSAGDLFPLIPTVRRLRSDGHDVRFAVSRALGLYLRTAGLPMYALGDGSEMNVLRDSAIVTTRFQGWASWRRVLTSYVAPTLERDLSTLERVIDDWSPDVIVTSGFAVAARLAAHRQGVPRIEASIYPQHITARLVDNRLGQPLRRQVGALSGLDQQDPRVGDVLWGADARHVLLLHDPALLGARQPPPRSSAIRTGTMVPPGRVTRSGSPTGSMSLIARWC